MTCEESGRLRKFRFAGTCVQYVRYLEEKVEQLQRQLASSSPSSLLDESQLVVQLEHPEKQTSKAKSDRITKCNQIISDIVAKTPASSSDWTTLSRKTKLSTREEVLGAFKFLTLRSPFHPLAFACIPQTDPTHSVVQAYSGLHSFLQHVAQNSTQLANYSSLLFFCICRVALKNGMRVEDVDNFAKECHGIGYRQSQKFRRAAGLVAKAIDKLERERGYLCPLLFLNSCPSMNALNDLADRSCIGGLFAQVSKRTEWVKEDARVSVSFNPAFLLTYFGGWTLDNVNSSLETSLSHEEFLQRKRYVEQELAGFGQETREATSGWTAKRQKVRHSARERCNSLSDENPPSDSQEVGRVDSQRRPGSASSDLCAPTTAGTLLAHSDGRIHTPQNGMLSPPPSSVVGVSTPDHAVEAVTSGNQDNTNSFNRTEVDPFSQCQGQNPNFEENTLPFDSGIPPLDFDAGLPENADFDISVLEQEEMSRFVNQFFAELSA